MSTPQNAEKVTLAADEHAIIATAAVSRNATEYDYPELVEAIERIIADRLAPVRAVLHAWEAWDGSQGPDGRIHPDASSPRDRERLRAALSIPSVKTEVDDRLCQQYGYHQKRTRHLRAECSIPPEGSPRNDHETWCEVPSPLDDDEANIPAADQNGDDHA